MFNSVLVVCVGNICRSPMAEALLRQRLANRAPAVRVESAGIAALVGHEADPISRELMRERGLDLGAHRARQLTAELMRQFELVLVMEAGHQRAIEAQLPSARGKVHRLGRFGDFDVPDPHRRGREVFEHSLELIERGVDEVHRKLWGSV